METLVAQKRQRRRRVVLVPYPYQGHITPMLQLASILHSKGFSITIAHTEFNAPNPSNHPEFSFSFLPDKLSGYDTSFDNMLNVILAMNANCKAPFRDCMDKVIEKEEEVEGEVACIVYDSIMQFVDVVANDLKIPTIVLRTNTAAYMQSHTVVFELIADKVIPIPESQLHEQVPKLHPLRFKDLPLPSTIQIPESILEFTKNYINIRSSSAVIWNSPDLLERSKLQQLQQQWQVPFFPIGPLHKLSPTIRTHTLLKEDTTCLSWLDKQAPNSVLYVSLGSLATIDKIELHDMAWGLARSRQPFLWVVRPSLLINESSETIESLPKEFFEEIKERGCLVKWAPQKKVLAHASVGGFLSHCGWNSTLESLSEGVPMICRPCFSDQMVNARYVCRVWRVGVELEEGCVERGVRRVMVGEEGREMRARAGEMKRELEDCVKEGGSSYESVEELVKFVESLTGKK